MKTFNEILKELPNKRTKRGYGVYYSQYETFLNGDKPTVDNAHDFALTKKDMKPSSQNYVRMSLRTYFRLNDIELPRNRLQTLRFNNVREDKFVTEEEVNVMHKSCERLRDRAIIRVLYHGGMRATEFLELNVGDIDFKNGRIKVKGLKGSHKVRSVRLTRPKTTLATVNAYLERRGINIKNITSKQREEPLILSERGGRLGYEGLKYLIKIIGSKTGKDELTPHWFRHGFAVWNKIEGISIEVCAMQMGDRPETVARIYSHFSQSDVDREYDRIQGKTKEVKVSVDPMEQVDELQERLADLEAQQSVILKTLKGLNV